MCSSMVCSWMKRLSARKGLIPSTRAARVCQASSHGILTELTHAEIDQLYSDPSVEMYRAEAVIAEFPDGSHTAALCFNLPILPRPDEANPNYAANLREVGPPVRPAVRLD